MMNGEPTGGTSPLVRGVGLAVLAAVSFGVTAPFLQRASAGVATMTAGALLYLGAAAGGVLAAAASIAFARGTRRSTAQPGPRAQAAADPQPSTPMSVSMTAGTLGVVLLVAGLGAIAAPALLVAGLRRSDAASGSLLLTLEAPLTVALASIVFHERLGARVVGAASAILAGALLLVLRPATSTNTTVGLALIGGATLCWALDNLLSRRLAEWDPARVVVWKGAVGGVLSAAIAVAIGEPRPALGPAGVLLLLGALGYGVSLRLYLRAQTLVGAARTASVFAAAPFVGAGVALALGSAWPGWRLPAGAALMVLGVALHLSERHRHVHTHEATTHEHLHTHDDGHHTHTHRPMPAGAHSHAHQHEPLTHEHAHSEDLHHRHVHPHET